MSLIIENLPLFLVGLRATLILAAITLVASTVIGIALGVLATLPSRAVRIAVAVYVETLRDIPLIVTIFAIFFGAPFAGMPLQPLPAVAVGLSLWGAANGAEIVRGGIQSIPAGQAEAATALGLHRWQIYRAILLPQAFRAVLPAYTGLLALIVQSTSLGALVGVTEFLKAGSLVIERSTVMQGINPSFQIYGFVLLVYFTICSLLSWASRRLNRRMAGTAGRIATPDASRI
jgi:polar amino acid transport system permease protein